MCIDRGAANPTVSVTASGYSARSLTAAERVSIAGGQLNLDQPSSFNGLDLTSGTLNVSSATTLTGTTTLTGASTGGYGTLINTGTFLVPVETTLGVTTRNDGTLRIGTGALHLNRKLTNQGTIELNGDGGITGPSQLAQNGILRKIAGTGTSLVGTYQRRLLLSHRRRRGDVRGADRHAAGLDQRGAHRQPGPQSVDGRDGQVHRLPRRRRHAERDRQRRLRQPHRHQRRRHAPRLPDRRDHRDRLDLRRRAAPTSSTRAR